jgi:hypothetical protein
MRPPRHGPPCALLLSLAACSGPAFTLGDQPSEEAGTVSTDVHADLSDGGGAVWDVFGPDAVLPDGATGDAGDAGLDVVPGVLLPDVLPLLPGDAGGTQESSMTVLPASCEGLVDGATTLSLPSTGKTYAAWCSSGKTYLTVGGPTFSEYVVGGYAEGTTVTTTFTRVRFYPASLEVGTTDLTFATSTGRLHVGGGTPHDVTSEPLGVAESCDAHPSAQARVDLSGTGFFFLPGQFGPSGDGSGSAAYSPDGTAVDVVGGGYCGTYGPLSTALRLGVGP